MERNHIVTLKAIRMLYEEHIRLGEFEKCEKDIKDIAELQNSIAETAKELLENYKNTNNKIKCEIIKNKFELYDGMSEVIGLILKDIKIQLPPYWEKKMNDEAMIKLKIYYFLAFIVTIIIMTIIYILDH